MSKLEAVGGYVVKSRKLLTLKFFLIISIILLLNAIIISIKAKSIEPGLRDIGGRLLLPTLKLSEESKKIVEEGGVYKPTKYFFGGVFNVVLKYLNLLSPLLLIILWIRTLGWLWARSPVSNISNIFINYLFLAPLTFIILQMLLLPLLINQFVESPLINKIDYLMLPITSFIDFFKVFPYLIKNVKSVIEPITPNATINNSMINF